MVSKHALDLKYRILVLILVFFVSVGEAQEAGFLLFLTLSLIPL